MNKTVMRKSIAGGAAVILSAFLLFYLPSMLTLFARDGEPVDMTILSIVMATCYTSIFCLNYFLFVPDILFKKNKKALFFITNFVIIIFVCSLLPLWFENHGGLPRPRHLRHATPSATQWVMGYLRFIIRDGIMMVLSAALAYALRLSKAREIMMRRVLELEAERRNIELMSLKAQLNPHFLFNSLNNIYALIAIDADRAQKALHDLSSLLRFMIYDAEEETVSLEKEFQFIEEYVRLMSLRLNPSVDLRCDIAKAERKDYFIAPLLFLTLIENAFKHLDQRASNPFLHINVSLTDKNLICSISNSKNDNATTPLEKSRSGVGLKNVERQLRLLYPSAFSLDTIIMPDSYTVSLSIELKALVKNIQSGTFGTF